MPGRPFGLSSICWLMNVRFGLIGPVVRCESNYLRCIRVGSGFQLITAQQDTETGQLLVKLEKVSAVGDDDFFLVKASK